jgi:hypothetical protein
MLGANYQSLGTRTGKELLLVVASKQSPNWLHVAERHHVIPKAMRETGWGSIEAPRPQGHKSRTGTQAQESDQQTKCIAILPANAVASERQPVARVRQIKPEPAMMHGIQSRLNVRRQAELVAGSVQGLWGALR